MPIGISDVKHSRVVNLSGVKMFEFYSELINRDVDQLRDCVEKALADKGLSNLVTTQRGPVKPSE